MTRIRCGWCGDDPLYVAYHDGEWGVPVHDDPRLFEMLTLEGAQAGLSWITVLRKRVGYRRAFAGFDFEKVARYGKPRIEALMQDSSIVKNRLKIESTVQNAKALMRLRREHGSFDAYLWRYVDGKPVQNAWKRLGEIPAQTELSKTISRDLKKEGFRFVGPTIVYAFMQAVGMVNDHLVPCFRHAALIGRQDRGSSVVSR